MVVSNIPGKCLLDQVTQKSFYLYWLTTSNSEKLHFSVVDRDPDVPTEENGCLMLLFGPM